MTITLLPVNCPKGTVYREKLFGNYIFLPEPLTVRIAPAHHQMHHSPAASFADGRNRVQHLAKDLYSSATRSFFSALFSIRET